MQVENENDKDWLDALAGRTHGGMDHMTRAQALAVRHALMARRASIEADAAAPDSKQFERLRSRLEKEGLLFSNNQNGTSANEWLPSSLATVRYRQRREDESEADKLKSSVSIWQRLLAGLGFKGGSGGSGAFVATRWGALAIAVVGVVFALRVVVLGPEQGPPADVLRGGTATVQIVADPQATLGELRTGLLAAKAVFTVKTLPDGRIQLDIQANDSALAYLDSVRILPTVKDGSIRIVIEKQKSP